MKKVLLRGILLGSMCLCALGIQRNAMFNTSCFSGLMLENVEALSYDQPEVVITCGKRGNYGPCWREGDEMKFCGEYTYYQCSFTGYTRDNCPYPC